MDVGRGQSYVRGTVEWFGSSVVDGWFVVKWFVVRGFMVYRWFVGDWFVVNWWLMVDRRFVGDWFMMWRQIWWMRSGYGKG